MQLYTLTTPLTIAPNSISSPPVTVSALKITAVTFNILPAIAPLGTGTLSITLADSATGYQLQPVSFNFNPDAFWGGVTVASGQAVRDAVEAAVFALLTANKLLPAGALSTVSGS